ncbi:PREDICTED: transmembrane protease serine 12-like [Thamnophis sirtalis]|uniref:Transmembrane protease serine 12-like n=1 Tax=Thamnophis sirtalis TaxID=35019 RepID=A0A6I9XM30_9SAUR|nr:PREDICTED: transmembrane protease serine 12-like [Thamnophis sirtalis]
MKAFAFISTEQWHHIFVLHEEDYSSTEIAKKVKCHCTMCIADCLPEGLKAAGLEVNLCSQTLTTLVDVRRPRKCGTRPAMDETVSINRIVGGRDAPLGAWPWQVSLQVYSLGVGYHHICGGVVITNNSLLTAAHCIKRWKNPAIWRVVIGLHNLNEVNCHTIKRRIKAINIHPNYMSDTYDNDIALIILVRSIKFNDYVRPICLPATNLSINQQYPCYISGWELKNERNPPLRKNVIDNYSSSDLQKN